MRGNKAKVQLMWFKANNFLDAHKIDEKMQLIEQNLNKNVRKGKNKFL